MRRRRYMQGSGEPPAIYNETDAKFYYRQTGGGAIIDNSPLVGRFDKIKGNTIAWNQIFNSVYAPSGGTGVLNSNEYVLTGDGTTTSQHSVLCAISALVKDHVYASFAQIKFENNLPSNTSFQGLRFSGINFSGETYNKVTTINQYTACYLIGKADVSSNAYIRIGYGTTNFNAYVKNLVCIDLTLIYGAGNEPSTPEQFEADYFKWFGKPLIYEPYDSGSFRSVKMSGIKSVGFNQWDEEWESGVIDADGNNSPQTGRIRSKNFIKVIPSASYYFYSASMANATAGWLRLRYYDYRKNFVSVGTLYGNGSFTIPNNVSYVRFCTFNTTYGTTYNNDICINISDTNKNGTYETHWSETRNIPITTLTGKVNGQGESVVVFPDGMLSAGSVHDEIYKQGNKTYAVKRVGRIDLGSFAWSDSLGLSNQTRQCFETEQIKNYYKTPPNIYTAPNFLCPKFIVVPNANTWKAGDISITPGGYVVCVNMPSQYVDGQAFVSAMQGVYLNYELAEPIIYELDGFTLPVSYNCAALGTEEILPENNSTPTSVAPIVDTSYRVGHVAEKPWYGIKWSEDNGQMQRIASNMELHATLPIQSKMKRCMLLDNGSVYKYISDADPFLYEDGTSVKYDGTDGQVMVEVPAYWYTAYKETDENNITWNYLKLYPKGGGQMYSRKIYRGAFEMITDNSDNSAAKGCSVSMLDFASMGTTKDTISFVASAMKYLSAATSYMNWNYPNVDPTNVKNGLGKPTTGRNRATFRSIAARRGTGFSQEYWDSYNSLIRLYVVEYCNFDIQASINDSLTVEGFRQGGLGAGVTNADTAKWSNFNYYNSFIPCGVTVPLGNKSGAVTYAFINKDFHNVDATYSVPSYRGIENPFGHIEKFIDGLNRKGKVDNSITTEMIYVCDIVSKFAEDNADGYILQSDTAPRATGNFGGVDWNVKGTFWPKPNGRTMYSDYFYNAYANNTWYTLTSGSRADGGSNAGLFSLRAYSASSYANDGVGSRLLYTK